MFLEGRVHSLYTEFSYLAVHFVLKFKVVDQKSIIGKKKIRSPLFGLSTKNTEYFLV